MSSTDRSAGHAVGCLVALVAAAVALGGCSGNSQQSAQAQGSAPSATAPAGPVAQQAEFAAFQGEIPATLTNRQCSLDEINGQPAENPGAVATGSTVIFGGWAGNGQGQAAEKFALVLKGAKASFSIPLATGVERADVAKAWSSQGMTKSGFNISGPLTGVAAGSYSLYVVDPVDSSADCDLHRTLTVQ